MSGVFRDVEMTWKGQTVRVVPSIRLLRQLESDGINILGLIAGITSGKPQLSWAAAVVGHLLRSAAVEVTDEEVYAELMLDPDGKAFGLVDGLMLAVMPTDFGKKSEGQTGA